MPVRSPLRAVLVDVGGTLWADGPPAPGEVRGPRSTALLRVLPRIDSALAVRLADELERASNEAVDAEERVAGTSQRTAEVLEKVTADLGIDPKLAPAIRRAIASAGIDRRELFPGGSSCSRRSRASDSDAPSCRTRSGGGAAEMQCCFERLGIASAIGAYVTSYDLGVRKPDRAMFRTALEALDWEPTECVFIGNSERAYIEPAVALGMRAIRVVIEEPIPEVSAADAVTGSLTEVASLLRSWV